jgi:hypothetical protein
LIGQFRLGNAGIIFAGPKIKIDLIKYFVKIGRTVTGDSFAARGSKQDGVNLLAQIQLSCKGNIKINLAVDIAGR